MLHLLLQFRKIAKNIRYASGETRKNFFLTLDDGSVIVTSEEELASAQ